MGTASPYARNVCAQWAPHHLMPEMKGARLEAYQQVLYCCESDGNDFL